MAVPGPWSVKGVDPETREAAKVAARRAGLPLGAWLSQVIRTAAVTQFKGANEPVPGISGGDLWRPAPGDGAAGPAASGGASVPAPTMQALLDGLQRLAQRVERAEKSTSEAIAPLAERLDDLSASVEEVRERSPAVATAPVERAVSRISERLDRLESDSKPARSGRRRLFGLLR